MWFLPHRVKKLATKTAILGLTMWRKSTPADCSSSFRCTCMNTHKINVTKNQNHKESVLITFKHSRKTLVLSYAHLRFPNTSKSLSQQRLWKCWLMTGRIFFRISTFKKNNFCNSSKNIIHFIIVCMGIEDRVHLPRGMHVP